MLDIIDIWFKEGNTFQVWWFKGKQKDHYNYIETAVREIETRYVYDNIYFWKHNSKSVLGGILLFDQFYRHIQKNNDMHEKYAVELCIYGIQQNLIPKDAHHLVFFLMPFRHTNNNLYYNYCVDYIKSMYNIDKSIYYEKFLRASQKQHENLEISKISYNMTWLKWINDYRDILCDKVEYKYNKNNNDCKEYKIWKCFIKFMKSRVGNSKKIIISLSGGVDSMVFLYLCKLFQTISSSFKFIVVHINWNQRPESIREAEFLISYLKMNNISFLYEDVSDLSREEDREYFESKGKEIRFNLYKRAVNEFGGDCVFLGHHRGDIVENVFTNMINGCNFLDLGKMKKESRINGVTIIRPFLEIDKKYILEFARYKLIPFFKNSTPDWSNRGKIRKEIFPQINVHFRNFENGLVEMAERSNEFGELIYRALIDPYLKNIKLNSDSVYELEYMRDYPKIFYELVFEKFMFSIRRSKISKKAINSWYEHTKLHQNWRPYTLSKHCKIKQQDDLLLIEINQ